MSQNYTSRIIYVVLQNGWGNIIIELMTAYALSDMISGKNSSNTIIGLTCELTLFKHQTIYNEAHKSQNLPDPGDIGSIIPNIKCHPINDQLTADIIYAVRNNTQLNISHQTKSIALYADWIGDDLEMLLPINNTWKNWIDNFKPSNAITSYINKKYFSLDVSSSNYASLHVRTHQPGDTEEMKGRKSPTPQWFAQALRKLGSNVKRVFIISGVSTANYENINYLREIIKAVEQVNKSLEIIIVSDEPYYVDFFILALSPYMIMSNSSFALSAAFLGLKWGNMSRVITTPFIDELCSGITNFPGFEKLEADDHVIVYK